MADKENNGPLLLVSLGKTSSHGNSPATVKKVEKKILEEGKNPKRNRKSRKTEKKKNTKLVAMSIWSLISQHTPGCRGVKVCPFLRPSVSL